MPQYHDLQYFSLVEKVLVSGVEKSNRTGVDTLSIFGHQLRFDLRDGTIPLLTSKKVHFKSIVHELLWFLAGDTNIKYLNDNGVKIWNEWADDNGDLGPVYGAQWRKWAAPEILRLWVDPEGKQPSVAHIFEHSVDQISELIRKLRTNPNDRRLLVSGWNVGELHKMALPPCHRSFQCWVQQLPNGSSELSMMIDQRSCDIGLGVPFNLAQYAILLRMLCMVTQMVPGELIWNGGDVHIYVNHVDQLMEQLTRSPFPSPTLRIARNVAEINDFVYEDFEIQQYESHPAIKMDVAV